MVLIPSSSQFISKAHTAMTQQKPCQWLDGKKHSRWTIKWLISPASMIKCIAGNRWVFFRKTKTKPNAAHDKSSGCAIECARILTKSKPTVVHADDFVLRSSAGALTPKKKWANTSFRLGSHAMRTSPTIQWCAMTKRKLYVATPKEERCRCTTRQDECSTCKDDDDDVCVCAISMLRVFVWHLICLNTMNHRYYDRIAYVDLV